MHDIARGSDNPHSPSPAMHAGVSGRSAFWVRIKLLRSMNPKRPTDLSNLHRTIGPKQVGSRQLDTQECLSGVTNGE